MKENKSKTKLSHSDFNYILFSIALLVATCMMLVITAHYTMEIMNQDYLSKVQNDIDDRINVSEEYRQGWNDCISRFKYWQNYATNMTSNITKLMD